MAVMGFTVEVVALREPDILIYTEKQSGLNGVDNFVSQTLIGIPLAAK
jgi:hypothetical protein